MNRPELITAIAEQAGITKKDAGKVIDAVTDVITEELKKGGKVQIIGFGTFEVSERPERKGFNPQTGDTITIRASKNAKFTAGKALKDSLN